MAKRSLTLIWAGGLLALGSLMVLLSFVSPAWLVTDGKLENPKFIRLGLWEVCFNGFEHPRHWYDTIFSSCWWVFEEEFYIIHDLLLPGFFVATQLFFTVTLTLCIISGLLILFFWGLSKNAEKYILLLLTLGALIIGAGTSGLISVIIFGARGDGRDWMPNWEHNNLGWSFAIGVIGVLLLFPSGILYLIEARVNRYKRLNEIYSREQSSYDLEERKSRYPSTQTGHTDI